MDEVLTISQARPPQPCTLVILGASGDLATRKLLPALYNLEVYGRGLLPPKTAVLGFARTEMTPEGFRQRAREAVQRHAPGGLREELWNRFAERLDYLSGLERADGFERLKQRLQAIETARGLPPNRIFYLSVPPDAVQDAVVRLDGAGLIAPPRGEHFSRVVVEKPIGNDLASAMEVNRTLRKHLAESQIFRIDHYLGKEVVQNLFVLRFANGIFEDIWNNRRIAHVQITVAESEGLGSRAAYYDPVGALRDMVQNHLLQLLSLVAMEPPVSLDPTAVRHAKANALRALRPAEGSRVREQVVRARYRSGVVDGQRVAGYLEEPGVRPERRAETFVALKVFVDNWRWSGVPFYLRTGKRLARRASAVFVVFKEVPEILFNRGAWLRPNVFAIRIQPDEGFSLDVLAKEPGLDLAVRPVRMNLRYASEFGQASPDAYEHLLLEVMSGDHTLFLGASFVRTSWEFVQTILDQWQRDPSIPLGSYEAGSWGPPEADRLLAADGRAWFEP
ncbi:MAG: glucose-6-phosphate dehydrogenase [Deltaproteobacteria bacterium]|jgi:glucose-6-phosphate 1-dehydrogenase|nr:glucose-6-phosphate dehydrogenase [Deltaproteobacteria bacterium]